MNRSRLKTFALAMGFELGLLLPAVGLGAIMGVRTFGTFHFDFRDTARGLLASAPMLGFFLVLLQSRAPSLLKIRDFLERVLTSFLGALGPWEVGFLSLAAGIGEEVLFREVIQGGLASKVGFPFAWLIASVLFGLAHLITPAYAVITTVIGMYLGLWYEWTGNIWVPIITHAFYDFVALQILFRRSRR